MKALILAAGKGERFFPFNVFRPKPMFPICNRPLLEWTVSRLVDVGITDIGIVVGHRGGRARNYFGNGQRFGCKITYIEQPQPKGTAHAVGLASDFIGTDDVLVIFGDVFFSGDAVPHLLDVFKDRNCSGVAGIVQVDDLSSHIRAHVEKDQSLSSYTYKPRGGSGQALSGLYVFKNEILPDLDNTSDFVPRTQYGIFRLRGRKFAMLSHCSMAKDARLLRPICPGPGSIWTCPGIPKMSRLWHLLKWLMHLQNRLLRQRLLSIPTPALAVLSSSMKIPRLPEMPILKVRSGSEKIRRY